MTAPLGASGAPSASTAARAVKDRDQDVVLRARDVTLSYRNGKQTTLALRPTSLDVHAGETVSIIGRSGSGKSTFAEIVLGLRRPNAGTVHVDGELWADAKKRPPRARRRLVQGVPQDALASFLPRVPLARQIGRAVRRLDPSADVDARLRWAAEHAQLDPDVLQRSTSHISGGQGQRAAFARALAVHPAILVADEPTSALDHATSRDLADAMFALVEEASIALLLVTHDLALAARCHRTVEIHAGTPTTPV